MSLKLFRFYKFECKCVACNRDWPLSDMLGLSLPQGQVTREEVDEVNKLVAKAMDVLTNQQQWENVTAKAVQVSTPQPPPTQSSPVQCGRLTLPSSPLLAELATTAATTAHYFCLSARRMVKKGEQVKLFCLKAWRLTSLQLNSLLEELLDNQ